MRSAKFFSLFVVSLMTLVQCGGGGGGGNKSKGGDGGTSGLEIADQMALVTAQDSSASSSLSRASSRLASLLSRAPSGGDYATDEAEYYVFDKSMEDLDMVNEILCSIRQTRYFEDSLLNGGPYIALVDIEACGQREDHSMDGSNQSSSQEVSYEEWYVNSSREEGEPHVVEFWVLPQDFEWDTTEEIRCRMEITGAQSDANPFGLFEMNCAMVDEFGPFMSVVLFSREADGDQVEIGMIMDGGEGFQMNIHARMEPDGSSGQGYSAYDWYEFEGDPAGQDLSEGVLHEDRINVAFNSTHYLARYGSDGETAKTEYLDRINYRTNVWEYNLYDPDGNRADLNGGFGIRYGSEEDQIWGHAGYYGVWLPEDQVTIENGLEVTRADDGTAYTVSVGAGRLIRKTRDILQLDDFIGDIFHHWHSPTYGEREFVFEWDLMSKIFDLNENVNANYNGETNRISIEAKQVGTAGNSIAIGATGGYSVLDNKTKLTGGSSNMAASATIVVGENVAVGSTITIGSITYTKVEEKIGENLEVEWDGENFIAIGTENCDGENGCTFVAQDEEVLTFGDNEWISLWKDGLGSLQCVTLEDGSLPDECPYYSEVFVSPSDSDVSSEISLQCYYNCPKPNLTAADLCGGNPSFDDVDEGGEPYIYTFSAEDYTLRFDGEPVTVEEGADLTGCSHNWGSRSGAMVFASVDLDNEPWKIWEAETIYEWETGTNQWNKYQGLVDADGNAVTFDQPLSCLYRDDVNGTYFLQYEGTGQLHGFPFEKIEDDDFGFEHWVPLFSIADGSELECNGSTYYSRQMKVEQFMQTVDPSECGAPCAALEIDEDFGAADDSFDDPEMDSHPEVTSPPAVIGGVLQ